MACSFPVSISWNFPTTNPLTSYFILLLFPHLNSQERDSDWPSLSFRARQLLWSAHGLHPLGSTGMIDRVVSAKRRSQTGQPHLLAYPAWQGHKRGLSEQKRTQSAGSFHGRLPQGGEFWRQKRSRIPEAFPSEMRKNKLCEALWDLFDWRDQYFENDGTQNEHKPMYII